MEVLSYEPQTYRSLSSLSKALDRFDNGHGQHVLDTEIRDLFQENEGLAELFGISLLHRHCDLSDDEILVEHGSTSTPWIVPADPSNFMNGRIEPRSWSLAGGTGEILPYEFRFEEQGGAADGGGDPRKHPAFMEMLRAILVKHHLETTLGLISIPTNYAHDPSRTKYERTFGRANVVFNVSADGLEDKDKRTSIWAFGRPNNSFQEAMPCITFCQCKNYED